MSHKTGPFQAEATWGTTSTARAPVQAHGHWVFLALSLPGNWESEAGRVCKQKITSLPRSPAGSATQATKQILTQALGYFPKCPCYRPRAPMLFLLPASEMLVSSGITCCRKLGWKGDRAVMWPLLLVTTKHREASLVSLLFLR